MGCETSVAGLFRGMGKAAQPDLSLCRTSLPRLPGKSDIGDGFVDFTVAWHDVLRPRPRGRFVAVAATKNALAAGVRPETTLAGKAIPLRAMAVFSSARNPRDVDVVTTDYSRPLVLNRTPGENTHR